MPSEKYSPEHQNDEASLLSDPKLRRSDVSLVHKQSDAVVTNNNNDDGKENNHDLQKQDTHEQQHDDVLEQDSDSYHTQDPPEFSYVDLLAIRKEVQCPICLGIIKKTRTVMECLHRFCRECIDKSMRMGNNECPACRTHCPSRRSLRDDPRFDDLIATLYSDIRKFEEEELAFYEEDEVRNKQIQESITQVLIKQSEALGKKRPINKDTAGPSVARSQRKHQNLHSRKRRRRRNSSLEYPDSDDHEDVNDSDKHFSPNEHHLEIKPRRARSRSSIGVAHSPSATNLSAGSFDNNVERNKEGRDLSPALTIGTERLSWGRGGVRSNTRNGNGNDGMSKRSLRLAKLVDFLHNLKENDDESALQTSVKDENFQRLSVQDSNASLSHHSMLRPPSCSNDKKAQVADSFQDSLHRMDREEIHPGAVPSCISNGEQLILSYSQKEAV